MDTVKQVLEQDPVSPSRVQFRVPRDLETICMKCLQKEPRKRYATAKEMADDLNRYLRGEPIKATPNTSDRARRQVGQAAHRPTATVLAFVTLGAVLGCSATARGTGTTSGRMELTRRAKRSHAAGRNRQRP